MTEFNQDTLFGPKIISSVGYDEQEIIRDILFLHNDSKPIELDPTYSVGNFYKKGLSKPRLKFDKNPQSAEVQQSSCDSLPLEPASIESIMFDPPFVISGEFYDDLHDGSGIISKRFTAFKSWDELRSMYKHSLHEFKRILRPSGILIFKCQDVVSSGLNHFSHCWVMDRALEAGFYPKDLFILLSKARMSDGRKQQHARKFHSYFWVFVKTRCRIEYDAPKS